jgi:butyryl-CoA dehydrogenase
MNSSTTIQGCSFLLNATGTERIFTPSEFNDEQRSFAQGVSDFMEREILPDAARLEKQEDGLMLAKLKKAGEAGLLMIDVPEEYGGLGLDKSTSMLCAEKMAIYAAFSVTQGAHTGIGSMPLMYFGNAEQKARYLPRLATGEIIAAYALTEPGSGSDALGARTTAVRTEKDGKAYYKLNGTKMWITNAGFADLFTVFAKVDGEKFTAFLVEAAFEGVSTGAEEHKMGIKGSSTRMVILEDVMVPEENLLGEIGRGHKIAFNILNIGRFKLGVGVLGGGKRSLSVATKYALERKQFDTPIAEFGAIRGKLASMTTELYALESMCYRVAGYMDQLIDSLDGQAPDYIQKMMDAIEEFTVEDSIMKVFGSETTDFVADEAVQIHGGYGFSQEYEVERTYRDSRINRIFEGTNEINRLLIPGTILKRAMKGELPLMQLVGELQATIGADKATLPSTVDAPLAVEAFLAGQIKSLTIFCANMAIQKHMADLKDQQQVLLALADLAIAAYGVDCTVARVMQQLENGDAPVHVAMAKIFAAERYHQALTIAQKLLPSLASGDDLAANYAALDKFTFSVPTDLIALKRVVADHTVEMDDWNL